jgi:hypothetical protein
MTPTNHVNKAGRKCFGKRFELLAAQAVQTQAAALTTVAKGSFRLSIFTTGTGSLPLGLSAVAVAPLFVACSLQ